VRVWCTYVQYNIYILLCTRCPHASPPSFLSARTQSRNYHRRRRRRRRRRYFIYTKKKTRSKNTRLRVVGASTAAAVWSVDREKLRGKIITIYHVYDMNVRVRYVVILYNIIIYFTVSGHRLLPELCYTVVVSPFDGFLFFPPRQCHTHISNVVVRFVF